MNIDSMQIESFLAVAKHLNFSKAAAELYLTQPVLSRRISKLEGELGVTLFDRTQRTLKLTPEGVILQTFFQEKKQEFQSILAKIDQTKQLVQRKIRIGICEGLDLSTYFQKINREWKKRNPKTELEFDSIPVDSLIEKFKQGFYDVILIFFTTIGCYQNSGIINKIKIQEFLEVHQCVLFSKNNPLFEKDPLSFTDFASQTLYCLKKDHVPQKILSHSDLLAKYGIQPKVQFLSSLDAITMALQMGEGFAISDNHERILNNKDIVFFNLPETLSISIVTKEHPPLFLSQFLSLCQQKELFQP